MRTLILILLLAFISNVNGGMLAHAQEQQPVQPKAQWKMLPTFINCTDIKTLESMLSGYQEKQFSIGNGTVLIPAAPGRFDGKIRTYVNPETGSFTVVLMLNEEAGCIVIMGKDFGPWTEDKNNT